MFCLQLRQHYIKPHLKICSCLQWSQALRYRIYDYAGASCNFQDYNGDRKLCGGVYVGDDWGLTLTTTIQNCEIACFSYAGIFKSPRPRTVIVKNCYVHKVKANGNAPGLGYGCWAQGGFLDPNDDGNITYENVILMIAKQQSTDRDIPITGI
ncbi:MAG: hypothetical protein IPN13_15780 [Bacteroidetes bacterium]|nr:hypothetical protein [Bacteroidota bacterium]